MPRWSEHVRELHKHANRQTPKARIRRRYMELRKGIFCTCLNFIAYATCSADSISAREAISTNYLQPRSHGTELKHFQEGLRPNRTRSRQPTMAPLKRSGPLEDTPRILDDIDRQVEHRPSFHHPIVVDSASRSH